MQYLCGFLRKKFDGRTRGYIQTRKGDIIWISSWETCEGLYIGQKVLFDVVTDGDGHFFAVSVHADDTVDEKDVVSLVAHKRSKETLVSFVKKALD